VSTSVPVSIIPEIERFGYVITPTTVLMITFEGEVWLYYHSYSCVGCLCEEEV